MFSVEKREGTSCLQLRVSDVADRDGPVWASWQSMHAVTLVVERSGRGVVPSPI
jgi:hypothetical protein